jgi:hypothetical protein
MYQVPGLELIPQTKNMSCWYASAQMLIKWQRNQLRMSVGANADPSQIAKSITWEVANNGIINPQVIELAKVLGLRVVPPASLTLEYIEALLRKHGPLWTNGKAHITVIGGINRVSKEILVFDPWPPNAGEVKWRPFATYLGNGNAGRDTGADVQASFLYLP